MLQKFASQTWDAFLTAYGIKTKGRRGGRGSKYRLNAGYYIHQLVWFAFHDEDPSEDGLNILHADEADLDKEGCYTNYENTLSKGTQSENIQGYHDAVKRRKLNDC